MKRYLFFFIASCILLSANAQQGNTAWSLRQCIQHALDNNIGIKQRQTAVRNSEIALSTARNSRLPNLNASASQSFNFGRGLTSDNTYTNRNTQSTGFDVGTSMPLFTGGQIPNTVAARRIDLQAAIADLDKAREDVSLQVTSAFLEALYQQELLEVAQQQVQLSQTQLRRIELLNQNGKNSPADVAQARSTLANDQLTLTQQQNALQLSLLDLTQMLELPTPDGFAIAATATDTADFTPDVVLLSPDSFVDGIIDQRPAIQAEQYRLESAKKNVSIAKSGLYPSLNLNGGIGASYYKTSGFPAESFSTQLKNNFNKYLGISLSIPIFNRFSVRNQVRQAQLQVESQQLTLEQSRKALYKEMQQAYYNAVAAQKQFESSTAAMQASEASFILMQKKFENGKATSTEYEESKTRHMKATADQLQAKYTFIFRQKILQFYQGIPLG